MLGEPVEVESGRGRHDRSLNANLPTQSGKRHRNDRESAAPAVRHTVILGELASRNPLEWGAMDGTARRVPALRLLHAVPNWLPGRRCPGTLSNHLAPASSSSQMYCPRRHDE